MASCAIYFRLRNNADCLSWGLCERSSGSLLRESLQFIYFIISFARCKTSLSTNDRYLSESVDFQM